MIHALKPVKPAPAKETLTSAQQNPAVAQCREAWERARHAMVKKKKSDEDVFAAADSAYCKAMPPLVGYENIFDFIACVGYGILTGRFEEGDGTKLL